jgi:hypothetical protein
MRPDRATITARARDANRARARRHRAARFDGRPACQGSLTVEVPIDAGARQRVTASLRSDPDGLGWWTTPTVDKQASG